jgi:ariadne-1
MRYKIGEILTPYHVSNYEGDFECSICYEFRDLKEAHFVKACNDFFCKSCFSENLNYLIEKTGNVKGLNCPKCRKELPKDEIISVLDEGTFKKFKTRLLEMEVAEDEEKIFCPYPNCLGIIKGKKGLLSNSGNHNTCDVCKSNVCFPCRSLAHSSISCRENQANLYFELNLKHGIGYCPNCKSPVEKDSGCPQMSCQRCSYSWCWICGQK